MVSAVLVSLLAKALHPWCDVPEAMGALIASGCGIVGPTFPVPVLIPVL